MKKGLTVLELLLSIAIIAIILAASIPFYFSFYVKAKNESLTKEILTSLHRAKLLAMASEDDDSWGLEVGQDSKVTIFRGSNYDSRNQLEDETIDIDPGITFATNYQIIFAKSTGLADSAKTISFTDTDNNNVIINIDTYGNATVQE